MQRPYLEFSTQELDQIFRGNVECLSELELLEYELRFRTQPHAIDLMERVQEALEQLRKETRTDKNLMAAIKFFMEGEEARKALREVEDRLDAMRLSNLALRKEVATVRLANSVDFDDVVSLESERTKEIKTVMISEVPKGKERLVDKVLSPEHAISEGLLGASVGERIVLDSRVEYRVMQITKEQQGFFIEVLQ